MHGYKESDFYNSEAEKAAFQKKLSRGYEILDKFIIHLNASKLLVISDILNDVKIQKLLELSTSLIGFIGEFAPAWSFRRWYLTQLLQQKVPIDAIEKAIIYELKLSTDTMLKNTKFYAAWQHRLLIITQFASKLPSSSYNKLLEEEPIFVDKILALDGRNFHCWRHINYLKQITPNLTFLNKLSYPEYLTFLIKEDFSNFSAWHERALLDTFDTGAEIKLLHEAIYTDPDDSSIWAYYKKILTKQKNLKLLKSWKINDIDGKSSIYLFFSDYITRPQIITLDDSDSSYTYDCIECKNLKYPSSYSRVWKINGDFNNLSDTITVQVEIIHKCADNFYKRLASTNLVDDTRKTTHKFIVNVSKENDKNVVDFDETLDEDLVGAELCFIEELLAIESMSVYLHLAKIFILKHSKQCHTDDIVKCYDKLMQLDPMRVNYYNYEKSLAKINSKLTTKVDFSGSYLSGFPYNLSVKLFGCQSLNLSNCGLSCSAVDGWHIPLISTLEILNISDNKLENLKTLTTNVVLLDIRNNPLKNEKNSRLFTLSKLSFDDRNPNLKIIVTSANDGERDWVVGIGERWAFSIAREAYNITNLPPLVVDYLRKLDGNQQLLVRQA